VELRQRNADAARHLILGFLERMNTSDHMYRDSMSAVAACVLGDLEMREARTSEALTAYRRAWHAVQEHPRMAALQRISARVQAGLASAYAAGGEQGRALELLSKAVHTTGESISPAHNAAAASLPDLYWGIAAALVRTGDLEQGLRMLEAAVRTGWRDSAWLCGDPEFEALRSKPGFTALIKAIRRGPGINFVAY